MFHNDSVKYCLLWQSLKKIFCVCWGIFVNAHYGPVPNPHKVKGNIPLGGIWLWLKLSNSLLVLNGFSFPNSPTSLQCIEGRKKANTVVISFAHLKAMLLEGNKCDIVYSLSIAMGKIMVHWLLFFTYITNWKGNEVRINGPICTNMIVNINMQGKSVGKSRNKLVNVSNTVFH